MKKNLTYIAIFCLVSSVSFFACSKKNNSTSTATTAAQFYVISNTSLANAADTLQSVYFDKTNNLTYYFYGSFDGSGKPLTIRHSVIKRGDTLINILYDSSLKINEIYYIIGSYVDTNVYGFSYYTDSIKIMTFNSNWSSTGIGKLKNITTVNTQSLPYSVINTTNFRTTAPPDPYAVQVGSAVGQSVLLAGALGIALVAGCALTGGLGCLVYVAAAGVALSSTHTSTTTISNSSPTTVSSVSDISDVYTKSPEIAPVNPMDNSTNSSLPQFYFTYENVILTHLDPFNTGSFCQYENPGTSTFSDFPTSQLHIRVLSSNGAYSGLEILFGNFAGTGVYYVTYPVPNYSTAAYELMPAGTYMNTNTLLPDWGKINITSVTPNLITGTFTFGTVLPPQNPGDACGGCNIQDTLTNGAFCIPFKYK